MFSVSRPLLIEGQCEEDNGSDVAVTHTPTHTKQSLWRTLLYCTLVLVHVQRDKMQRYGRRREREREGGEGRKEALIALSDLNIKGLSTQFLVLFFNFRLPARNTCLQLRSPATSSPSSLHLLSLCLAICQ